MGSNQALAPLPDFAASSSTPEFELVRKNPLERILSVVRQVGVGVELSKSSPDSFDSRSTPRDCFSLRPQ
jgi:hypothetical protein